MAKKILVVEDDGTQARALANLLTGEGYEVHVVSKAVDALADKLSGFRPDLVILDWMLPDATGDTIVERLRGGVLLPTIILTASSNVIFGRGVRVLTKPADYEVILAAVHEGLKDPFAVRGSCGNGSSAY